MPTPPWAPAGGGSASPAAPKAQPQTLCCPVLWAQGRLGPELPQATLGPEPFRAPLSQAGSQLPRPGLWSQVEPGDPRAGLRAVLPAGARSRPRRDTWPRPRPAPSGDVVPPQVLEGARHSSCPPFCPEGPQTLASLGFLMGPRQLPGQLQFSVASAVPMVDLWTLGKQAEQEAGRRGPGVRPAELYLQGRLAGLQRVRLGSPVAGRWLQGPAAGAAPPFGLWWLLAPWQSPRL